MKHILPAALTAMLVAGVGLSSTAAAGTAAAPAPSPSASAKKDPCGSTKSKWAHVQCENYNNSAPGDEYFGRMKMSYLGIDNTFKDGFISAGVYTTDQRVISKLMFADDALQRWSSKYPGDPQIARSYFLGVAVFRKVYTQPGQELAWHYMQVLLHQYPKTYFGKAIKAALDKDGGFTEHWFAAAEMCPTPLPRGVQAQPTAAPTTPPTPTTTQPAVQLIDPPCIPPPTPEPTATPTPKVH